MYVICMYVGFKNAIYSINFVFKKIKNIHILYLYQIKSQGNIILSNRELIDWIDI